MTKAKLNTVPVGTTAKINDSKILVSKSSNGCHGCMLRSEAGARLCQYSVFCFAHNRLDNKSVVFVKTDK